MAFIESHKTMVSVSLGAVRGVLVPTSRQCASKRESMIGGAFDSWLIQVRPGGEMPSVGVLSAGAFCDGAATEKLKFERKVFRRKSECNRERPSRQAHDQLEKFTESAAMRAATVLVKIRDFAEGGMWRHIDFFNTATTRQIMNYPRRTFA